MSVKLLKHQDVEELPFALYTASRKLNYTTEYAYSKFYKIGNLVSFVIMWKGKINESGERAYINVPKIKNNMPAVNTAVSVAEFTGCIDWGVSDVFGQLTSEGIIGIYTTEGAAIGNWKKNNGTDQYLKISGTYICK